jgi:hypothetical protein
MPGETPVVLVVDDDAERADLYAKWLADEYDVRVAADGRAALGSVDEADAVVFGPRRPESPGLVDAFRARVVSVPSAAVVPEGADPPVPDPDARVDAPATERSLRTAVAGLVARSEYQRGVDELFALAAERASQSEGDDDLDARFAELDGRLGETLDELVDAAGYRAAYRAADPDQSDE